MTSIGTGMDEVLNQWSLVNMIKNRGGVLFLVGFGVIMFFLGVYINPNVKSLMQDTHYKADVSRIDIPPKDISRVAGLPNDALPGTGSSRHDPGLETPKGDPHDRTKWTPPLVPEHLQSVDQDNEELIQHIREHWIIPPFPAGQLMLHDETKTHYSQFGQSTAVDKALSQKTDGFFIECGAGNGENLSNSLFFEKYRNWTGLLVEADPEAFAKVLKVRRHSFMVNACLSPNRKPAVLNYTSASLFGGLDQYMEESHRKLIAISGRMTVQCFPLVSILKAIGINDVDYFSLDVEGSELDILRTIPFETVNVQSLTVQYKVNGDRNRTELKLQALRELMTDTNGYKELMILSGLDIFLIK